MSEDIDAAAIRLQHFATRLIRLARSTHREYSLSSAQYSAMAVLHEHPGVTVVELARREGVAHPTMSRLVAGLIEPKLVTREPDPNDGRSRLLFLTAPGRKLYLEVAERRILLFRMLLSQLSPATIAEIMSVVERSAPALETSFRHS